MLVYRFLLAIVISVVTLLISTVLDAIFAPLPFAVQFLLQIPVLVILIDEGRRWLISNIAFLDKTLTKEDIDGCFFFAAPIAAVGSFSLFKSLGQLRPF